MASREDTQRRRQELRQTLLATCETGQMWAGATGVGPQALPPVRSLAQQFNLSVPTVRQVIEGLRDEGFLHTRSTAGTFAGPNQDAARGLYLVLTPYGAGRNVQYAAACRGFEERIAQLAGSSLVLDWEEAQEWQQQGTLPQFAGIFELGRPRDREPRPSLAAGGRVVFAEHNDEDHHEASIRFDNFDGGRQAALHLLKAGHRKVAFLGLHARDQHQPAFAWSAERAAGWTAALQAREIDARQLSFLPLSAGGHQLEDQVQSTLGPARELLRRPDITAVISVNPMVTAALHTALGESGLAPQKWPAIVSFDDTDCNNNQTITVVRLPWEKLGRRAADLLWQRSGSPTATPRVGAPGTGAPGTGTPGTGAPDTVLLPHLVPMLLISRLSCRAVSPIPLNSLTPVPVVHLHRAELAAAT